jgi:soluble lytic murein transglycosylase-like protein
MNDDPRQSSEHERAKKSAPLVARAPESARRRTGVFALGLLVASASWAPRASHADFFEYVDAEGVSHYTNVPQGNKSWRKLVFEGRRSRVIKTPLSLRDHSPQRYSRYDAHLLEAARLYTLPVALLRAVVHVESDFDPKVVSVDGAMGLMQLMPFTAEKMGVDDPFDPRQNILGGARFLRVLANQWKGDLVKTVASYNAGAGAVERYHGVPPYGETRRYVNRVLERYYAYRAQTSG